VALQQAERSPSVPTGRGWTVGGVLLLALVLYIHLALFFRVHRFDPFLGWLFLLDVLGALGTAIGIAMNRRWAWGLGILPAGGAAVVRLMMDFIPSFSRLLLPVPKFRAGFTPPTGGFRFRHHSAAFHGFAGGGLAPHRLRGLPLPGDAALLSIIVELLYVVVSLWVLSRSVPR